MTSEVDTYEVEPREVLGKKVKRLRRDGVLPANLYGRGLDSVAVQMPLQKARDMLYTHGTNTLIKVRVAGESEPRPVIVRDIKRHPVNGNVLHVDFYQVDLKRTLKAFVPVNLTGEAPAIAAQGGILLQGLDTVQLEALPSEMPDHLEISVDGLMEIDDQLTVAALVVGAGVTMLSDPDQMVARVTRPRLIEEVEEVLEGEEELAEGEEAPEGEEGEESADGDSD
jgi:large subunit ribosomal protein L25